MKSIIASTLFLLAPPLAAQNQLVVNGVNPSPGEYETITLAVAAATSGDEILVKDIYHNGDPIGYTEDRYQAQGGGESFPIQITKSLTVRAIDATKPVLIWSSAGTAPPALFEVPQGVADGSTVVIEGFSLIGGERAVNVLARDGKDITVLVRSCDFDRNQTGLNASANSGGTLEIAVRHCKVVDVEITVPPLLSYPQAPNYQNQSVGIGIRAGHDPSIGHGTVTAEILNLRTAGDFANMAPAPHVGSQSSDPELPFETTRLISVTSVGGFAIENPLLGVTIPQVEIDVIGGVLNGRGTDDGQGWGIGFYAKAANPVNGTATEGYTSGWRASMSGVEIRNMRIKGVQASTDIDTRGELSTFGCDIESNGVFEVAGSTPSGEGVRGWTKEGYLYVGGDSGSIARNGGNGIGILVDGSNQSPNNTRPAGVFVSLHGLGIHENGGNGIYGYADFGSLGGAWKRGPGGVLYFSNVAALNEPVRVGQGVIEGCAISNNGQSESETDHRKGIWLRMQGTKVEQAYAAINLRLIDNIIWNHPHEGVRIDADPEDSSGFCFAPIVHCTVAGNGDTAAMPANVEYAFDRNGVDFRNKEQHSNNTRILVTKIYNSIFERKVSDEDDLGPELAALSISELPTINQDRIPCAGLRAYYGGLPVSFPGSAGDPAPFLAGVNWTATDPTIFYFATGTVPPGLNFVPSYLDVEEIESNDDHEGTPRPVRSAGTRDKGADHEDNS